LTLHLAHLKIQHQSLTRVPGEPGIQQIFLSAMNGVFTQATYYHKLFLK
jgi:hypothetical protein